MSIGLYIIKSSILFFFSHVQMREVNGLQTLGYKNLVQQSKETETQWVFSYKSIFNSYKLLFMWVWWSKIEHGTKKKKN